jgi:mannitol-1-phosphate 5-dehydrogenase
LSNNKLALHFGAGNIGRGFICPELKKSNYDVVFVDVNEDLINEINLKKKYKVTSLDINSESSEVIHDVRGISINDNELLNSYLSKADVISTSVGPKYVQGIYELIDNVNTAKEIFFIAFENQYRSSTKAQPKNSKNMAPLFLMIYNTSLWMSLILLLTVIMKLNL